MAGASSALNLSLLSRGVGEVSKNGHEKIDVVFEPQDYFNFVGGSRSLYLPPISTHYSFDGLKHSPVPRIKSEVPIPKTFTTRKGALLLYSEDIAQKRYHQKTIRRHRRPVHFLDDASSTSSQSDDENDLRTVDDLAKSILSYGSQPEQHDSNGVYLKFLHGRRKRDYFERQIRPGYSAKRYLSSWTKSWDDAVLEKVISKGYLTEKSLFYYNPLMPHLHRRLNDDMSHYPTPYRLMRSMLKSPGSLSGYTFYRVRPESAETIMTQEIEMHVPPASRGASIKVISTKDGVQKEVTYASLDKKAQEEVLTDLLVKSAVHYAIKKQQEYFEDSLARVMDSSRDVPSRKEELSPVPRFDMKDAVETLLDAQKGSRVLDTDFPDDRSQQSGSFKGKAIHRKRKSGTNKERGSQSVSPVSDDREYVGNVPVVSFRATEPEHMANITSLPRIPGVLPLPPIGEASREGTKAQGFVVTLPSIGKEGPLVNVEPPTPQHTVLSAGGAKEPGFTSQLETPEEYEGWATDEETKSDTEKRKRRRKLKAEGGPVVSGGAWLQSSSESLGAASMQSMPERKPVRVQWKGSTQSIKSKGSKGGAVSARSNQSSTAGSGLEDSIKGSVIIGPGGEMMNVGGAIQPIPRQDVSATVIDHVHDANKDKEMASEESDVDEPDEWKQNIRPRHTEKFANRRAYFPQEMTILSRATEKTEEGLETDRTKDEIVQEIGSVHIPAQPSPSEATLQQESSMEGGKMSRQTTGDTPQKTLSDLHADLNGGQTLDRRDDRISEEGETIITEKGRSEITGGDYQHTTDLENILSESSGQIDNSEPEGGRKSRRASFQKQNSRTSLRGESSRGSLNRRLSRQESISSITIQQRDTNSDTRRSSITPTASRRMTRASLHVDGEPLLTPVEPELDESQIDGSPEVNDEERNADELPKEPEQADVFESEKVTPAEEANPEEESAKSELSEEEIVSALTEHAQKIATSVLSQDETGANLEADIRRAAELWMELHPPRQISRSQSMQELANRSFSENSASSVIDEVIKSQKQKSAGPTAGEYRELIRESLKTAIVMSGEELPPDTEVSQELLETLKSKSVSPEDIEVVQDEDGKALIRSKSQMKIAMGGVKEGHIFVAGDKNGARNPSIPADRQSNIDVGEIGVINYGLAESETKSESDKASEKAPSEKAFSIKSASGKISTMSASSAKVASEKAPSEKAKSEKGKSQPASVIGESIIEEPETKEGQQVEVEPEVDEFQKAVEEMEKQKESPGSPTKSEARSVKSGKSEDKKSRVSVKSEKSLDKSKTSDKKEEFVVGNVDYKGELEKLFGKVPEPKGKPKEKKPAVPKKVEKKGKKGKAKAKKKEEPPPEAPPPKEPTPPPPKEPTPPPPKEPTPPPPEESDKESVAESKTTEEDDYEFTIVRDSPSPSPPPPQAPSTIASAEDDDYDEKDDEDLEEDDEAARLRMISNREARAAKRAAQAEKRKQEVEQRRKEREEQLRREKEQQEKQMQFKLQMEEERRRREEERRLKKQAEEDERLREEREEEERLNRQRLEQDKEKRRKEEYQRKLEEMKRKQIEEEQRKKEEMLKRQQEEEERKRIEQEMLATLAEEERLEYERKKKLEEEERKRKEEEERLRREEEARLAMEEARRLAEEMARKQAEMEARLKFNRALQLEAGGMNHSQGMTRAFVFSYYELLQWLGLDIPEFELLKLTQY